MLKSPPAVCFLICTLLLALGCRSQSSDENPPTGAAEAGLEATTPDHPATAATTEALSAARNSLQSGELDQAAARLAQLQMQGATFNTQQAKDYRQTLSEAYDRAIEAAQRGDPRGEAALQLLRAAAPR